MGSNTHNPKVNLFFSNYFYIKSEQSYPCSVSEGVIEHGLNLSNLQRFGGRGIVLPPDVVVLFLIIGVLAVVVLCLILVIGVALSVRAAGLRFMWSLRSSCVTL